MYKTKRIAFTGLFTALIAAGAFLKIPTPLVPITLQLFFSTLAGTLIGAKAGGVSVLCYIALGLAGLPIFSGGGGPGYVFQPTFGYILGFALGAYVTGTLVYMSTDKGFMRLFGANLAGMTVVYAVGVTYFCLITRLYLKLDLNMYSILMSCFVLTLPSDVILCAVSAVIGKRLIPVINIADKDRQNRSK